MCVCEEREKEGEVCVFVEGSMAESQFVKRPIQTFGRKKSAVAVAHVKPAPAHVSIRPSHGTSIRVNGVPIHLLEPEGLRFKVYEPLLLIKMNDQDGSKYPELNNLDIRVRVSSGGHTSRLYAVRQAIAKSVLAYFQKFVDEESKNELKHILKSFDKSLVVADPRRTEPKKFGGPGARARYQKSYR